MKGREGHVIAGRKVWQWRAVDKKLKKSYVVYLFQFGLAN